MAEGKLNRVSLDPKVWFDLLFEIVRKRSKKVGPNFTLADFYNENTEVKQRTYEKAKAAQSQQFTKRSFRNLANALRYDHIENLIVDFVASGGNLGARDFAKNT